MKINTEKTSSDVSDEFFEEVARIMRLGSDDSACSMLLRCNINTIKDYRNKYGNSIADIAAWNGCVKVLSFLCDIKFSFDTDKISVMGARRIRILRFLLSKGILNPNARDKDTGTTPLQQACNIAEESFGIKMDENLVPECLEKIAFLVKAGAKLNATNNEGRNALMGAAYIGAYPVVTLLLNLGADASPSTRCLNGKSAIDYAFGSYTESIIRLHLFGHKVTVLD